MIARKEDHMFDKEFDSKEFDLEEDIEDETDDTSDDTSAESEGVTLADVAKATTGGNTPVDLARLGLSEIAYIRRAIVNDTPMWTIHSAAGDPLGAAHSFDQAWAAVKQNDMEPMRVH